MEAALLRTGSITYPAAIVTSSPTLALLRQDSLAGGIFSGDKIAPGSPRFSLHLEMNRRRDSPEGVRIRRALSESDVIGPQSRLSGGGSLSFPARIPEEECGSLTLGGADRVGRSGVWPGIGIPLEEPGVRGGQIGAGGDFGGDGCDRSGSNGGYGGGYGDRRRIGDYYQEMLKSSPGDCLLLRNYGKYLHEVEGDAARAEEYYGRAILASPGDGDVLSLYGKLIWETQRDEDRAKSYFDQAVLASPDDSTVLGSYARFLWESEEEEDDGDDAEEAVKSPAAAAAF
ncbi:uncharacterized protein LOC115737007 [Rhodamnia argentea]|uniref:Uncharacterized protein LOC115737007 n=1 Tax=Rhodamnia argentea TaxID=178133 RepID=A0A8B8NQM6_9MYRT|nr:uncharacterized protein LOC115737007 [Rhodamnia argentea]